MPREVDQNANVVTLTLEVNLLGRTKNDPDASSVLSLLDGFASNVLMKEHKGIRWNIRERINTDTHICGGGN